MSRIFTTWKSVDTKTNILFTSTIIIVKYIYSRDSIIRYGFAIIRTTNNHQIILNKSNLAWTYPELALPVHAPRVSLLF